MAEAGRVWRRSNRRSARRDSRHHLLSAPAAIRRPRQMRTQSYQPASTASIAALSALSDAQRTRKPRNRRGGSDTSPVDEGSARQALARSEEHTPELQSLMRISYAVFCLKKKK